MTGTFGPLDLDAIREWNRDNRRARAEYRVYPDTTKTPPNDDYRYTCRCGAKTRRRDICATCKTRGIKT